MLGRVGLAYEAHALHFSCFTDSGRTTRQQSTTGTDSKPRPYRALSAQTKDNTTQTRLEESTADKLRRRANETRADEVGSGGVASFMLDVPREAEIDELADLYEVWKRETGRNPVAKWSSGGSR